MVGYGRIIRDEDGNVIDIILPEDEKTEETVEEEEEEEKERVVEAKTDVVKCESLHRLSP